MDSFKDNIRSFADAQDDKRTSQNGRKTGPSLTLRMTNKELRSLCHPEGGFLPEGSGVNPFKDNIRSFATLRMTNIRLRMAEKQILR